MGRLDESITALRRALQVSPDSAATHCSLAWALHDKGLIEEGVAECRRAIGLAPDNSDAHNSLGNLLQAQGDLDGAAAAYREAIRLQPDHVDAHDNLGNILQAQGRRNEAIAAYREALRLKPDFAEAHYNLGNAMRDAGELKQGMVEYQTAIKLAPAYADAWNNLGGVLETAGRFDEAVAAYREALRLKPNEPRFLNNLGSAFLEKDLPDEAIRLFKEALRADPRAAAAYNNLGNAHKDEGQIEQALESYRQAVALAPEAAEMHSNVVYSLLFHPASDSAVILEAALQWNRQHAFRSAEGAILHENDSVSERKLRIGYVSPDFREHVVGCNILPLLREHDRERFEVFCYSNVACPDAVTSQITSFVSWRNIVGMSDADAAARIRADRIDLLVDLTLHMARNRLPLFTRKPAPVQATYLGYCGTTGVEAIDYRLSDPYLDPPESDVGCYSERTIRLPDSYWCYEPIGPTPPPSPVPCITAGHVTFGCLNNYAKVSPPALDLWLELLRAVPGSRLLLHAPPGSCRCAVHERAALLGISADRIEFAGIQSWTSYLETLQRIDVALDPFPYGGGITTCDALWMGVPVITLRGQTAVGRGGLSILSNLGLSEWVAETPARYAELAQALANDSPALTRFRSTLRDRMSDSPLRDFQGHARAIEAAYRQMWQAWCAR